jgi:N-methyl-L-tryptophan oxidase
MQYDLIIIGSGSVGAAAGYYARQAGLNVLMTDAHQPPHQEGSHHGSTRLIRHAYGEGERYVPLVLRAQQLWDELAAASGEAVFERTGVINLGPASSAFCATLPAAPRVPAQYRRNGCAGRDARWPEIRIPDDYRAIFEPASGVLRSELAVETWIRLAREAGAHSSSTARSRPFITRRTA